MKKSALVFLAILFTLPVLANAQKGYVAPIPAKATGVTTYHRPYYEQWPLAEAQTLPYFLENRTGSPLKVTLLVELPTGGKEWWPFDIEPNSEVYAMLPLGGTRASVAFAVASVPKGNKLVFQKVKSFVYDREDENGRVQRGWLFFRK